MSRVSRTSGFRTSTYILHWAYSIFEKAETEEEEADSLEKLHAFITYESNQSSKEYDNVVNPLLTTNSLNFLTKSIIPILDT